MKLSYVVIFAISVMAGFISVVFFDGKGIYASVLLTLLLVVLKETAKKPKDISVVEKWGEFLPSKSGVYWGIPRKHSYFDKTSGKSSMEDSRTLLEKHGFTVLGIADQVIYSVEPPLGWRKESISHLHTYIYDDKGDVKLFVFRKNDIMNLSDYRGYVSECES
ncbi:MAG: hypothetical protein QG583_41 [Patescibacteria group bacterium]|nr:hypothetical protein [Patescibacteria group bacterium]